MCASGHFRYLWLFVHNFTEVLFHFRCIWLLLRVSELASGVLCHCRNYWSLRANFSRVRYRCRSFWSLAVKLPRRSAVLSVLTSRKRSGHKWLTCRHADVDVVSVRPSCLFKILQVAVHVLILICFIIL